MTGNLSSTLRYTHMYMSYYKAQKFAKICFSSLQDMREKTSFLIFFEKFRAPKRQLEIDDPKPPKKGRGLSDSEEAGAPVEFVSTVEDHYRQMFISAELLH